MTTEPSTETSPAKDTTASGEGRQALSQDTGGQDQGHTQDQTTRTSADAAAEGQTPKGQATAHKAPEGQAPEGQATDGQDPKPTGQKPMDQKPADPKLADQKAMDPQPADQKPTARQQADYALDLHQGAKADALTKWFQNQAKANGLSKDQAQAVYNGWMALQDQALYAGRKAREEAQNQLKTEWQKDYAANLALAGKAVQQVGGQDLADLLGKSGLSGDPVMIRAWNRIGAMLSEDAFFASGSGNAAGQGASPAELVYPNHARK